MMMRFNRGLLTSARFFGSVPHGEKRTPRVKDVEGNKQLRDKLHLQFMQEADKQLYYEQSRVRKFSALYNLMAHLPNSVTTFIGKFVSDPKVTIKSDDLYMPRLTPNGVPIYDSFRSGKMATLCRNAEILPPLLFLTKVHYLYQMMMFSMILYFGPYRMLLDRLLNGLVVKMELCPETEEIIYQKVGHFGFVKTNRVKISDLEHCDKQILNDIFYTYSKFSIDGNMIFRVKSTNQFLFFDPDGLWYADGVNHELLI